MVNLNNMNDNKLLENEKRNQTLVLVEGDHEKHVLFKLLLACFGEVPVKNENVHVYAADIYDLYRDIEKEYEEDWYNNGSDVDIPMLVSRRLNIEPQLDRRNFTNIIMIFDYEHHDTSYSDEKIKHMQGYFCSLSDAGMLFINYPMVEAYKHIKSIPDEEYMERYVSVKCHPGCVYKNMVEDISAISKYFSAYEKLSRYVKEQIPMLKPLEVEGILLNIGSLRQRDRIRNDVYNLLLEYVPEEKKRNNMAYSIAANLSGLDYWDEDINYFQKIRNIFTYIISINIKKAIKLQGNPKNNSDSIKEQFQNIDWNDILEMQNNASKDDENGIIWVLSTAVTFLTEYKFYWSKIFDET